PLPRTPLGAPLRTRSRSRVFGELGLEVQIAGGWEEIFFIGTGAGLAMRAGGARAALLCEAHRPVRVVRKFPRTAHILPPPSQPFRRRPLGARVAGPPLRGAVERRQPARTVGSRTAPGWHGPCGSDSNPPRSLASETAHELVLAL